MMAVNALEAVCDLLLGFTFASLFGACSGSWLLIGAVLALGFLSALILQKSKGGLPARILCALLPALGLIFAKSLPEALPPAVVIAFFAVLIFSGKIGICYEDYKYWFGFPAVPAAVVFAICFGGWPLRPAATVCAAAYLFLGVLVLRYKRMGAGAGPRLRAAGFAELTGALVFAVLAGLLLYAVMKHSVKVLETLLMPVGYLISGLAFMFDWIVGMLGKMIPEDEQLIPPEDAETVLPEDVPLTETVPEEPADALAGRNIHIAGPARQLQFIHPLRRIAQRLRGLLRSRRAAQRHRQRQPRAQQTSPESLHFLQSSLFGFLPGRRRFH